MNPASIAVVTATRLPDGMEDTHGLLKALRARGARADLVAWSDPAVAWADYDRVLLHAPWDYSEHLTAFDGWLEQVVGERLVNPLPLMRWNTDKRYLNELAEQGVPVPATVTVTDPAHVKPDALTAELGPGPLVVKSTVGAGGRRTWLLEDADAACELLRGEDPPPGPALVQEFVPSVRATGEYSAIQIGGRLSHVVRKVPAEGEFRVQHHYGGTVLTETVRPWMEDFVAKVGSALPGAPRYARIDFVLGDGNVPLLMEAEVVEPDLFLRYGDGAYDAFASVLTTG
ncbi:RimK family alpha-L-glutamate ligase [Streptomyces sp. NPDC053750]|uniref:RimK family alpha-L-glutamate ligase n=1 Tax=Streptomyces sp. NPDC053750 TaxID=3365714 RepID=UPI0037D60704